MASFQSNRPTYGNMTRENIERMVNSPGFPAWCERMELRMQAAVENMNRELDAAIRRDLAAAIERKRRCSV